MKEKVLLKIALVVSLLGILVLFFISGYIEKKTVLVSEVASEEVGTNVKVEGIVTNFKKIGSGSLINIAQLDRMEVFVFGDNITLYKGDYVEIEGRLDEYDGNVSLIADKIVLK